MTSTRVAAKDLVVTAPVPRFLSCTLYAGAPPSPSLGVADCRFRLLAQSSAGCTDPARKRRSESHVGHQGANFPMLNHNMTRCILRACWRLEGEGASVRMQAGAARVRSSWPTRKRGRAGPFSRPASGQAVRHRAFPRETATRSISMLLARFVGVCPMARARGLRFLERRAFCTSLEIGHSGRDPCADLGELCHQSEFRGSLACLRHAWPPLHRAKLLLPRSLSSWLRARTRMLLTLSPASGSKRVAPEAVPKREGFAEPWLWTAALSLPVPWRGASRRARDE